MANDQRRVRILCEDRRTERFICRLCERYRVRVEGVETWLAHLCGVAGIDEDTALKDHAAARGLWKDGPSTKATLETAAYAWHGGMPALPSLEAAYAEAPRVGLGSR